MGAGHAKEVRDRWPSVAKEFGEMASGNWIDYFLLTSKKYPVMAFQTKRHWKDPSSFALVFSSTCYFNELAKQNPNKIYHLAFPGIGKGGLKPTDVWKYIKELPDNVHIWTLTTIPAISSFYEHFLTEEKPL
jgi:hypothetical protein